MLGTYSARIDPIPGRERVAASVLEGLGFRVFRVDDLMRAEASAKVWQQVFGLAAPVRGEILVPFDLADLVKKVVLD